MSNSTTSGSASAAGAGAAAAAAPTNKSAPKNQAAFEEIFRAFAKFGDSKSTGETITLSNSDKWMKQAKVIELKKITTTDTGIAFKKVAK